MIGHNTFIGFLDTLLSKEQRLVRQESLRGGGFGGGSLLPKGGPDESTEAKPSPPTEEPTHAGEATDEAAADTTPQTPSTPPPTGELTQGMFEGEAPASFSRGNEVAVREQIEKEVLKLHGWEHLNPQEAQDKIDKLVDRVMHEPKYLTDSEQMRRLFLDVQKNLADMGLAEEVQTTEGGTEFERLETSHEIHTLLLDKSHVSAWGRRADGSELTYYKQMRINSRGIATLTDGSKMTIDELKTWLKGKRAVDVDFAMERVRKAMVRIRRNNRYARKEMRKLQRRKGRLEMLIEQGRGNVCAQRDALADINQRLGQVGSDAKGNRILMQGMRTGIRQRDVVAQNLGVLRRELQDERERILGNNPAQRTAMATRASIKAREYLLGRGYFILQEEGLEVRPGTVREIVQKPSDAADLKGTDAREEYLNRSMETVNEIAGNQMDTLNSSLNEHVKRVQRFFENMAKTDPRMAGKEVAVRINGDGTIGVHNGRVSIRLRPRFFNPDTMQTIQTANPYEISRNEIPANGIAIDEQLAWEVVDNTVETTHPQHRETYNDSNLALNATQEILSKNRVSAAMVRDAVYDANNGKMIRDGGETSNAHLDKFIFKHAELTVAVARELAEFQGNKLDLQNVERTSPEAIRALVLAWDGPDKIIHIGASFPIFAKHEVAEAFAGPEHQPESGFSGVLEFTGIDMLEYNRGHDQALKALSRMVTTPGDTTLGDFKYRVRGLHLSMRHRMDRFRKIYDRGAIRDGARPGLDDVSLPTGDPSRRPRTADAPTMEPLDDDNKSTPPPLTPASTPGGTGDTKKDESKKDEGLAEKKKVETKSETLAASETRLLAKIEEMESERTEKQQLLDTLLGELEQKVSAGKAEVKRLNDQIRDLEEPMNEEITTAEQKLTQAKSKLDAVKKKLAEVQKQKKEAESSLQSASKLLTPLEEKEKELTTSMIQKIDAAKKSWTNIATPLGTSNSIATGLFDNIAVQLKNIETTQDLIKFAEKDGKQTATLEAQLVDAYAKSNRLIESLVKAITQVVQNVILPKTKTEPRTKRQKHAEAASQLTEIATSINALYQTLKPAQSRSLDAADVRAGLIGTIHRLTKDITKHEATVSTANTNYTKAKTEFDYSKMRITRKYEEGTEGGSLSEDEKKQLKALRTKEIETITAKYAPRIENAEKAIKENTKTLEDVYYLLQFSNTEENSAYLEEEANTLEKELKKSKDVLASVKQEKEKLVAKVHKKYSVGLNGLRAAKGTAQANLKDATAALEEGRERPDAAGLIDDIEQLNSEIQKAQKELETVQAKRAPDVAKEQYEKVEEEKHGALEHTEEIQERMNALAYAKEDAPGTMETGPEIENVLSSLSRVMEAQSAYTIAKANFAEKNSAAIKSTDRRETEALAREALNLAKATQEAGSALGSAEKQFTKDIQTLTETIAELGENIMGTSEHLEVIQQQINEMQQLQKIATKAGKESVREQITKAQKAQLHVKEVLLDQLRQLKKMQEHLGTANSFNSKTQPTEYSLMRGVQAQVAEYTQILEGYLKDDTPIKLRPANSYTTALSTLEPYKEKGAHSYEEEGKGLVEEAEQALNEVVKKNKAVEAMRKKLKADINTIHKKANDAFQGTDHSIEIIVTDNATIQIKGKNDKGTFICPEIIVDVSKPSVGNTLDKYARSAYCGYLSRDVVDGTTRMLPDDYILTWENIKRNASR